MKMSVLALLTYLPYLLTCLLTEADEDVGFYFLPTYRTYLLTYLLACLRKLMKMSVLTLLTYLPYLLTVLTYLLACLRKLMKISVPLHGP